ncbi:colicin immunity protein, partial [Escherichia coli]
MNRKFYFKNILWGMCPIIISILHLIYDTPTEASIKVDLFLILSGLALPCSIYLTKTITLKYTSISFWKKPLFWSYGIYHFHLVYIMICIVLAIPSAIIVLNRPGFPG